MFDEPAFNSHSPEHVARTYAAGRAKDPYHPQLSVYIGSMTYPLYRDFMTAADCQMMDDYPLPYFGPEHFGDHLAKLPHAARGRRTVWAVPQCFDWRELGAAMGPFDRTSLHPSGQEALNSVYQSIVHGASAITFWTYRYAAADRRRHKGLKEALAEGARLAELVVKGTVVAPPRIRPLCARIRCRAFQVDGSIYLVAVNPTYRVVSVDFRAPYLEGRRLERWLPTGARLGGLHDSFGPLEGRVYRVR